MSRPPRKPLSDKDLREKALAEALRHNLRRRKAAPRDSRPPAGGTATEPSDAEPSDPV